MSTPVAGPKTDTAAVLTLALGALAPAEPTDEAIYLSRSQAVEGAPAGVVYRRRMGIEPDSYLATFAARSPDNRRPDVLVHLGEASLIRRDLKDRLVGAVLSRAGRPGRLIVTPSDINAVQRAALLTIGENGIGFVIDRKSLDGALAATTGVVVVDVGDGLPRQQALASLDSLLASVEQIRPSPRIFLVSSHPPSSERGEWDRLTPIVLAGPDVPHGLLMSATTRTPGIVANVDVAPTLLRWFGAAVPATMVGHPIQTIAATYPLPSLLYTDRRVTLNAHALVPVFVLLGVVAGLIGFGGLAALWMGSRATTWIGFGVLFLMNMPLAMLLIPPFVDRVAAQAIWTIGLMILLAAAETVLGRLLSSSKPDSDKPEVPLRLLAVFTCLTLLVDTLIGGPLMRWSLFGADPLSGIRFYGIGNEYMGALVGLTLLWAFLSKARPSIAALVFVVVTIILGSPTLGAKAGGVVAAATAFGVGWTILRRRRVTWRTAVGWTVFGLALAFALALLDRLYAGASASHFGGALEGAQATGYKLLLDIVLRKIAMNLRISLHPGVLATLAGYAIAIWLLRGAFRERLARLMADHPGWARGLPAAGYGALSAFLFNDSGIVAAIFMLAAFIGAGLYLLFKEANEAMKTPESPAAQPAS